MADVSFKIIKRQNSVGMRRVDVIMILAGFASHFFVGLCNDLISVQIDKLTTNIVRSA